MSALVSDAWPPERLGEAVAALARRSGLSHWHGPLPFRSPARPDAAWLGAAAAHLGLEAEPIRASHREVAGVLRGIGPAVLPLGDGSGRFLALLGGTERRLRLLTPDLGERSLPLPEVGRVLQAPLEGRFDDEVRRLIDGARIPPRRRETVRAALLAERLDDEPCLDGFELRRPASASIAVQGRDAGLFVPLAGLVAAHLLQAGLLVLAWWVVGRGALEGRLDRGWLWAFALMLLTLVPIGAAASWWQARVAVAGGAILKRRLFAGALRLDPEEMRGEGAGQLLGRILESQNVETLALAGGFDAVLSLVEIALALWLLNAGAGGPLHVVVLLSWMAALSVWAAQLYRARRRWTQVRVDMSERLVEKMVGYRTRLAQEGRASWHDEEDADLEQYYALSRKLDGSLARFETLAARGFLLTALATLGPSVVFAGASVPRLAVSLGGMLLGAQALQRLSTGLSNVFGAAIAWRQVARLYHAAARTQASGSPALAVESIGVPRAGPILQGRAVSFRYPHRERAALANATFRIDLGDRVLVTGASGSGKSTLSALLSGLRRPAEGLLLLKDVDLPAWGESAWRGQVVCAPQFHENHLIAAPLAFNLLMGRRWPPEIEDVREALALCGELGLEDLLARMPCGIFQPVGETGWRLSHGERGRVFLARALLQDSEVVVLDESFGALDSETLQRALACTVRRAKTLVVVQHP